MADEDTKKLILSPAEVFVKGGTTSSAHDKELAKYKAEVEERRRQADMDRASASLPTEEGGAIMHTNKLTDSPDVEQGYVLLEYVTATGKPQYHNGDQFQCLADVIMISEKELALILVCPQCMSKGLPMDLCQIKVNQSHRPWFLDTKKAGSMIEFDGKVYRSAGEVMDSDRIACMQCNWSVKIDKNKVWPVP